MLVLYKHKIKWERLLRRNGEPACDSARSGEPPPQTRYNTQVERSGVYFNDEWQDVYFDRVIADGIVRDVGGWIFDAGTKGDHNG